MFSVGGGGCSFTPMLVNSDGWHGDHSSPGGELCVMHVLLLLLLIVRVHLHKNNVYSKGSKCGYLVFKHIFQCLEG